MKIEQVYMYEKVKINFKDNNVRLTDGGDGLKNNTVSGKKVNH